MDFIYSFFYFYHITVIKGQHNGMLFYFPSGALTLWDYIKEICLFFVCFLNINAISKTTQCTIHYKFTIYMMVLRMCFQENCHSFFLD